MSARASIFGRGRIALCIVVWVVGACSEGAPDQVPGGEQMFQTPGAGAPGPATAGVPAPASPGGGLPAAEPPGPGLGAAAGASAAAGDGAAGEPTTAGDGAAGEPMTAGDGAAGEPMAGSMGAAGAPGSEMCCADGDCICRDEPPGALTSDDGPYASDSYSLLGTGCIYYPTDAEPPFSAVAISDGFGGSGGCGLFAQTSGWGPFLASWGIVTMIVETTAADQPFTRGTKLIEGVEGFKAENENSGSPLFGKLAGRYGTSGFSMGGGGTTHAASADPTLKSSVGIMAWTPTGLGVTVPTLFTCGTADVLAGCLGHGLPAYSSMPESTPKMIITINSPHVGQPSAGAGMQGAWGLAFHKVFLDGDDRWRPVLLSGQYDDTNIQ